MPPSLLADLDVFDCPDVGVSDFGSDPDLAGIVTGQDVLDEALDVVLMAVPLGGEDVGLEGDLGTDGDFCGGCGFLAHVDSPVMRF